MRRAESSSCSSAYRLFRAYVHTYPRKRVPRPEPKTDAERAKRGLPLREPWFEVKPFDEKKMRFVLRLKDTLLAQPKQRIELTELGYLRRELDVLREGKQRKMATYVRRFPAAFSLRSFFTPKDKKKTWCTFTADALKLLEEEDRIFQASETLLVQKLRKILMISMKNRLPLATVEQVRQSLGLPVDFKESLVKKCPDVFLLNERKGALYLELKDWDESLAISVLEKNTQEGKYIKNSRKKRGSKLRIEEAEQEPSCKTDNEDYSDDHAISTDEGEEHEHEDSCPAEEKYFTGRTEQVTSAYASDLSQDRSSEHNYEQNLSPLGNQKIQALTNVYSESLLLDMAAIHSPRVDDVMQKSIETSTAECKVGPAVTELDSNPHTNNLSVVRLSDHESTSFASADKDGELQALSHSNDSETKSEKASESSEGVRGSSDCLRFPWITKKGKQPKAERAAEIESFQSVPYISPYRNSRELVLPLQTTLQTEKFLVGLIHEFLSLTLEKRATVQQLELFRRPYQLPIDLLNLLSRYDGIFYVARGKTKSHVFLKEGYKEFHLLEKEPLVLWQERFVALAFSSPKQEEHKTSKGPAAQDAQSSSEQDGLSACEIPA